MASDMDLEQQEREEELKRLEEDVKNSDVALDKLNSEYEEQMDEMAEEPEQEHGKVWIFFGKLHKALEKNLGRNIIIGVYAITVIRIIADLVMFMRGVFYVDYAMVPRNFFYYFFSIVIPYAVWIWSTKQSFTFFAFTNRKMRGLWIASISLCTVILNVMFLCTCMVAVPLIMFIPVSPDVTGSMIVNLARLVTFMLPVFVFSSCIKGFIDIYQFTGTKELIYKFKVDRNLDLRRNKASCYDYAIARDRKTGRIYRVAEVIRTMHLLIIGATGSGKTSMNFLPGIANDLNTRVKNENTQKKKVQQMLDKGEVTLIDNIKDCDFDKSHFRAKDAAAKKKLEKIFKDNPLCGITVVAPNDSLGDDVYRLAKKRGMTKINRIDPKLVNGKHKEDFIGFNPLFISPDITDADRNIEIVNKARNFANVLQAIFDSSGSSDPYFSNLNKVLTTSLTTVILKAYPILHVKMPAKYSQKQPTPQEFYDIMSDFGLVQDYVDVMNEYIKDNPEERNEYKNRIKYLEDRLLGDGAEKMKEQSTGLLNIIDDVLTNPLIRNILCCENSIDIDKALAENHVTIVNYDISLGSDSRAFGLFFLMNFQTAVFRRPKNNRPLNFLYIDELACLLHPSFSRIWQLYRQYHVCAACIIQNFSQFDEQPSTKFLLNVALNNSRTHIVFGNCGPDEMKYYQDLMGEDYIVNMQNTISESALSLEDTSLSYSTRTSITKDNVISGRTVRNQDFKEAYLYTSQKNNATDMFPVLLDFLDEEEDTKNMATVYAVKWDEYYSYEKAAGTSFRGEKSVAGVVVNHKPALPVTSTVKVNGADIVLGNFDEKAFYGVGYKSEATVSNKYKNTVKKMRDELREKADRESDSGIASGVVVSFPQNNSSENASKMERQMNVSDPMDSILGRMGAKFQDSSGEENDNGEEVEDVRKDTDTGATREEKNDDENISVEMCNSIDDILSNIAKVRK